MVEGMKKINIILAHSFRLFNPGSLTPLFLGHGEAYIGTYIIEQGFVLLVVGNWRKRQG